MRVLYKSGGRLLLRLNTDGTPIAQKYREGKMQSTLKRESKVPEIVYGEAFRRVSRETGSAVREFS